MQDLQGGRIDFMCEIISTAKPQIDGGTVKAIAIMTKDRSPALPNLATAEEQGTKGMEAYTWNAIFLPKGTPEAIVKKLADAANQAMETPAVKEKLAGLGAMIVAPDRRSPQYLQKFVKDEIAKWREPILKSGAQTN
jgi:tripartite-type tricarboxylate transporter receptor subunit TctC